MPDSDRNPHAGRPFTDPDAAIAAALQDVSVPALLCSMVHLTGDPAWIRGDLQPHASALNDYQGSMTEEEMAEAGAAGRYRRSSTSATPGACFRPHRRTCWSGR